MLVFECALKTLQNHFFSFFLFPAEDAGVIKTVKWNEN